MWTQLKTNDSWLPSGNTNFDDDFVKDLYQSGGPNFQSSSELISIPEVNIYESDKGFHYAAFVAGYQESDIQVTVGEFTICISAPPVMNSKPPPENARCVFEENPLMGFNRIFRIPLGSIDRTGITSSLNNGVLTVFLPKKT